MNLTSQVNSLEAVLHQLKVGEASEGDLRDIMWCKKTLTETLRELKKLNKHLTENPTIKSDRYMKEVWGLDIMEQVASVLAARHEIDIVWVRRHLKKADPQELYDNYLGPAIDKIEEEAIPSDAKERAADHKDLRRANALDLNA